MKEEVPIKYQEIKDQLLNNMDENHTSVFKSDLKSLTDLELFECHLDELQFLEHCDNLENLFFHNSLQRRPLQTLPRLPKLKSLGIAGECVKNLSFLDSCPNLEELYLASIGLVDISPVNQLTKLKKLSLDNINIRGFEKLNQLDTVVELSLIGISRTNVPFHKFPNVKKLGCREVDFRNFAPLFK